MINLLIVDDDKTAVKGIHLAVIQMDLKFDNIYCAYRMSEAQEIIENTDIHILLCDIEMPKGSGLELIEWINSKDYHMIALLLTSYADFNYAKTAITLGATSYLLKPISDEDLKKELAVAIERYEEKAHTLQSNLFHENNKSIVLELFWRELIDGTMSSKLDDIVDFARKKNITIDIKQKYTLALISYKYLSEELLAWKKSELTYALKNIALELFPVNEGAAVIMDYKESKVFTVFFHHQSVSENTNRFIKECNKNLALDINCYVSMAVPIGEISEKAKQLLKMEKNNVQYQNKLFINSRKTTRDAIYSHPDQLELTALILNGKSEKTVNYIQSHLDTLQSIGELNFSILEKFQQDILQIFYVALKNKGVQAHLLFDDIQSKQLLEDSTKTKKLFLKWICHITDTSAKYLEFANNTESVVKQAVSYIENNLDQIESREAIAKYVCMNPDHLSRLFKKEIGMPISQYVNHVRLNKARDLLAKTDIPVGDIAQMLGYSHAAHFSTCFKKASKLAPMDYRKEKQK